MAKQPIFVVKEYLEERAKTDPLFAASYAKENKSLDECWDYPSDSGSDDAVKFSYGSFDINGFPIMFEDMMCDDDEADKSTERKEFEDMWEDNSYDIRDKYPYLTWDYFRKPHIIGSIHDNPDLLNGK